LGTLLLLLGGCVNQQKDMQLWRDVANADLSPPEPYLDGQTLSLPRAMALANHDNEQIALQGENYLQALVDKSRYVAAFLPTVSFQPNFTLEDRPTGNATGAPPATGGVTPVVTDPAGFAGSGNPIHRTELPVVGSMNVNLPSNLASLQSAKQTIVQQRQLLLDAQATLLLNVAQAYYQVLRSERQVVVLRNSLDVQEARVRYVRSQYDNHLVLALALSQAVAQAAGTRAALTQAQTDVENGRKVLAFLIHAPQVNGGLADELHVPSPLPALQDYQHLAEQNRHDLQAAQAAVRAGRAQVDAAIGEYYPSVSLNVAGFLYREDFSDASKWDAILLANLPIFSAGIIEADVRDAWSRLRQLALNESYLRRQIDRDVQIAYQNLRNSERLLVDLNIEVQAAQDALQQSQQQLDNGLAIPLDVLTAQDTLLSAQLNYTSATFDREVFYLDLLRAIGRLTPQIAQHWPATRPATQPGSQPSSQPAATTRAAP
jgi:outer membrane protein TolC